MQQKKGCKEIEQLAHEEFSDGMHGKEVSGQGQLKTERQLW